MGTSVYALTDEDVERYSRQVVLQDIGLEGQERLKRARVAILGMGGLGTPAALLLARMGLGYLRIVDRDLVSLTDLHRQLLYDPSDVGLPKVEAARNSLRRINPEIEVDAVAAPIMRGNVEELIEGVDIVLDGLDNMRTRYIVNRAILRMGKPYIFSAAVEMFGVVSTIVPGETACLECFYPGLEDELLPKCAQVGVHPSVTSIVASISVAEAVRMIVKGEPALKGKLLFIDLRNMEFSKIDIRRNESCPACSLEGDAAELPRVEVGCARDGKNVYFVNEMRSLDLDLIREKILRKGWKVLRISDHSLMFEVDSNYSGTVMRGGSIVVEVGRADLSTERRVREILDLLS